MPPFFFCSWDILVGVGEGRNHDSLKASHFGRASWFGRANSGWLRVYSVTFWREHRLADVLVLNFQIRVKRRVMMSAKVVWCGKSVP